MKAEESTRWARPTACGWGGGVCGGQEPAFFFFNIYLFGYFRSLQHAGFLLWSGGSVAL